MKQHKTLFLLFLRHTAWKVLLILLLSAAVQAGLFLTAALDPARYSLEIVLKNLEPRLSWVVCLTFALLAALLTYASTGKGKGRTDYLLDRLAVPPREVILCQGLCNALAFLLFWGAEALILLGLCQLYGLQGGYLGPQTIFLASWQNNLFHSFLPLEELTRWVRNLIWFLGAGFTAAAGSARRRRKEPAGAIFGFIGASVVFFRCEMALPVVDLLFALGAAGITAVALFNAFVPDKEVSYEETSTF